MILKYFFCHSCFACFIFLSQAQPRPAHNLVFEKLAARWDEAMPLGNGLLGALVWQKNNHLRLALDRADLWDERPAFEMEKHDFAWVKNQVENNNYREAQKWADIPYETSPYPTKLPCAAIEFDLTVLGTVVSNELDIAKAVNTIRFDNGIVFRCFMHASQEEGYFELEGLSPGIVSPALIVPGYRDEKLSSRGNSVTGLGLQELGYRQGTVTSTPNAIRYHQPTYGNNYYEVLVQWKRGSGGKLAGAWTIANNRTAARLPLALSLAGLQSAYKTHVQWWSRFWQQSSVSLPDAVIGKQYYLEMYKLGSVSRPGAPAITLQAVWTADNGSLPPWKGDFHNDLNTQLSYWPAYTGNHLAEAVSFTNWLWKTKAENIRYTKGFFGVEGLNVPGVSTLNGHAMGGWMQYALSPTVSAWTAQHFYWQWKYSMDTSFLRQRAYPYIHLAATYMENITRASRGKPLLPLSSSPEYNDNKITAWFHDWTNFDLSLAKFIFTAATAVSTAMNKPGEASHWQQRLKELPDYDADDTGLTIAPGEPLRESHRHMSSYMAIYPLALLDINKEKDKQIIMQSLQHIEEKGTRKWVGYSFSWMAALYARAYQGDSAWSNLVKFATNFCSVNSFHLNGDQKGGQFADGTYRPFTLEGNFAFAQGVHEMLLQSREGYIQVFPALPASWKNVSFRQLRAEGAFLISAEKKQGRVTGVSVTAEKGGKLAILLPEGQYTVSGRRGRKVPYENAGPYIMNMNKGETVSFYSK